MAPRTAGWRYARFGSLVCRAFPTDTVAVAWPLDNLPCAYTFQLQFGSVEPPAAVHALGSMHHCLPVLHHPNTRNALLYGSTAVRCSLLVPYCSNTSLQFYAVHALVLPFGRRPGFCG